MIQAMRTLIERLNYHTKLYNDGKPKVSDKEWDTWYFDLVELEKKTGITFPDSPTQSISYEVVDKLKKITHNHPMLSLEKTKDIDELKKFVDDKPYVIMAKMDGLTCSLTYADGQLIRAETRGNGIEGEDILHNARVLKSIPKTIPVKGEITIDGEIICRKEIFEEYFSKDYKNNRNFASGSIRLLNSKEASARKLTFVAWDWINAPCATMHGRLDVLNEYGFKVVPYVSNLFCSLEEGIEKIRNLCEKIYPIDGIVVKYDDIEYGLSLGNTEHHFKHSIAYKFYDEKYETNLIDIEWTMGRTGVLTPVAVFNPVEIDGTTVERASLHNLTIMEDTLGSVPHSGQKIEVFKANMIIPQISDADKEVKGTLYYMECKPIETPEVCPICGGKLDIQCQNDSEFLVCNNVDCSGKFINRLDHFCGKKGLDIKGLSKATLEKLIEWNWVQSYEDLFNLTEFQSDWIKKPGFGVKSVHNILTSIEQSKYCSLDKFIAALGIPLVGSKASKDLSIYFPSWRAFREAVDRNYYFSDLDGFGEVLDYNICNFDYTEADILAKDYIIFVENENDTSNSTDLLKGQNIVITGKLIQFKNRSELQSLIENAGGKVVGSVSKNTTILINNDNNSTSSKNLSAKKLNIPIMTEDEFLKKFF